MRPPHRKSDGTYGVPRDTAVGDEVEPVHHERIARVMRSINLAGARLRRRQRNTVEIPAAVKDLDLKGRNVAATGPRPKASATSPASRATARRFLSTMPLYASPRVAWSLADHVGTERITDVLAVVEWSSRRSFAGRSCSS